MTPTAFLDLYPEFRTGGTLVTSALDQATLRVDASRWGARTDEAIGLLAADWLVTHPQGMSTRKDSDEDKKSRYRILYETAMREMGFYLPLVT